MLRTLGVTMPARLVGVKALAVFHFVMGASFVLSSLWLTASILNAASYGQLLLPLLLLLGLPLIGFPDLVTGWGLLKGKRYGWWLAAALAGARLVGGVLAVVGYVLVTVESLSPYITVWYFIGSILMSSGLFLTSASLLLLRAPFPALIAVAQLNVLIAILAVWYLYKPHVRSAFEAGAKAVAQDFSYRSAKHELEEPQRAAEVSPAAPTVSVERSKASARASLTKAEVGESMDEKVASEVARAMREMIERRARLRCELREEGGDYVLEIEAGSRVSGAVGEVRVYGMEIRISGRRCVVRLPKKVLAKAGEGFGALRSFELTEKDIIELYAESYAKKIVSIAKAIWT